MKLPDYLKEFGLTISAAESLKMSINDVESKFSFAQIILMSTIQSIQYEQMKIDSGGKGTLLNKGATPQEQNKNAWRYL